MFDRSVSLSMLCYPSLDLAGFCAEARTREVQTVSLNARSLTAVGVDDAGRLLADNGLRVSALVGGVAFDLAAPSSWEASRALLDRTVEAAEAVGAPSVYLVSGARPADRWGDALAVFADAVGPSVEQARDHGVRIAIEPTNWLYADVSFIHTLTDAIELAELAGTSICLDLFHVWTELHFDDLARRAAPHICHVQLSDYVLGDRSLPSRAVPGDGVVPLERLLARIRDVGYDGPFDLELSGPRIDAEGHSDAAGRGLAWLAHRVR